MRGSTCLPHNWHFRRESLLGTIEITHWPRANRLWLSVQSGRRVDWIEGAMERLKVVLEGQR